MSKQELMKLKDDIEEAKQQKAKDEGRLDSLMERLDTEFGIKTLNEAEKEVAKIEKEITGLEKEYNDGFKKLKENYEW